MPHVLFVAPHLSHGQRRFVRGLKRVGAQVTGLGELRPELLDPELRFLLDGYEHVADLNDEEALAAAVRRVQERGPWVDRLECTLDPWLPVVARVRARSSIPGLTPEQVALCADKQAARRHLSERGLACADDADEVMVGNHQGSYDTLTIGGEVVFEAASHYYPNVADAMRERWISPVIVHTNRIGADGYDSLRAFGRRVVRELGLGTTATTMSWLEGDRGLLFSELGTRPPACDLWDVYCEAGELDLYTEWARAICYGTTVARPSQRYAAGLINLRPSQDGTITGYEGLEAMQRRYGELIFRMHLPPPGTATEPISAGYLANAWLCLKHPDYDVLRGILEDVGRTVRVIAS